MPPQKPLPTASDTLPDQSVTTDKLADNAVTSAKQALTGSSPDDLGPGGSAARNVTTIYQNTTDKMLLLVINGEASTPLVTDTAQLHLFVDSVTPPVKEKSRILLPAVLAGLDLEYPLIAIVPPGYYYQVQPIVTGTGTATIDLWFEYTL